MHMTEPRNQVPRRPYRLRRRLESIEGTRRRITAAAFDLHATIGPARTTISAIAERAGVQRHTVYHHFPDLDALFEACTVHGMQVTGIPDPEGWYTIEDPGERLDHGLAELYGYYRANETMLTNVLGGIDPTAPPPAGPDPFEIRMRGLAAALLGGSSARGDAGRRLGAVVVHALAFETWRSLSGAGLDDAEIRSLMRDVVAGVEGGTLG